MPVAKSIISPKTRENDQKKKWKLTNSSWTDVGVVSITRHAEWPKSSGPFQPQKFWMKVTIFIAPYKCALKSLGNAYIQIIVKKKIAIPLFMKNLTPMYFGG